MLSNVDLSRAMSWASDAPLTDLQAISTVTLHQSVPEYMPENFARVARRMFATAPSLKANATLWLAIWPDGTYAMLAHNPDWERPRAEQLVRTYRSARAVGIRLPGVGVAT